MTLSRSEALARLRAGEPVAIPTETVYGLAADAENPLAVRRIFAIKGRPAGHPLIVHLAAEADLSAWGVTSSAAYAQHLSIVVCEMDEKTEKDSPTAKAFEALRYLRSPSPSREV